MGNCTSSGGGGGGSSSAKAGGDAQSILAGTIFEKDNGRNGIKFEVLRNDENGALIQVRESTFNGMSRFAKGKRVVVDNAFLEKSTTAKGNKYKSSKQAPDYIKEQVNIDINKFRNNAAKQFEKRGQIAIDISEMSKAEKNKLITALGKKYSPFVGELSGKWLYTISMKK